MARGAPDYTKRIEIHFSSGQAAEEYAWGAAGNYSGTSTTYQQAVTATVTVGRVAELKELIILSDDYAHTLVKVTIGSVVWCTDWSPTGAMPIIFEDLRLAAAAVVKVEAKSSTGAAIDVDAIIVGKEVG